MSIFNKPQFWLATIAIILFLGYKSYLKRNQKEIPLSQKKDIVDKVEEIIEKPVSKYLGNHLNNGESPYDMLYQKGTYKDTKHSLEINNQSSSDVVVLLIDKGSDNVIRNEYVRGNSSFEMTQLPNGTYYTKYYYGKNWNPTRVLNGVQVGGFDDNELFSVSDNPNDFLEFQRTVEGQYEYWAQYELTLETYLVEGESLSKEVLDADEFFNQPY